MNSAGEEKVCFVVGPIGSADSESRIHADWLLQEIIQPIVTEVPGFRVERADKIARPGLIDAQVINLLYDAELVIADLSFHNPNAFYEIGIRHMVQRPIIHMHRSDINLPFDVTQYRSIAFSWLKAPELSAARKELSAQLAEVLKPDYVVENPVTQARGRAKIEQHGATKDQVFLESLDDIGRRLEILERRGAVSKREKVAPDYVSSTDTINVSLLQKPNSSDINTVLQVVQAISGLSELECRATGSSLTITLPENIKVGTQQRIERRLKALPIVKQLDFLPF